MKQVGTFASRLREFLMNKGMYQAELVERINRCGGKVVASQLTMYLKGKNLPRFEQIPVFANAMGVSVPWLLGYDLRPEDDKTLELIHSLNDENKKTVLDMAAALKVKQELSI